LPTTDEAKNENLAVPFSFIFFLISCSTLRSLCYICAIVNNRFTAAVAGGRLLLS
jgi:hypothetical protein